VDADALLATYARWLKRQPLAPRSRDAYLAQVRGFVTWLAGSTVRLGRRTDAARRRMTPGVSWRASRERVVAARTGHSESAVAGQAGGLGYCPLQPRMARQKPRTVLGGGGGGGGAGAGAGAGAGTSWPNTT